MVLLQQSLGNWQKHGLSFLRQSDILGNKNKIQNKPEQLNKIENMEADKARITANNVFIVHSVSGQRESAIKFDYGTVIRGELLYQYQEEAKAERCLSDESTK